MTSGNESRAGRQAKIDAAAPKPSKTKPILVALVVALVIAGIAGAIALGTRNSSTDASPSGSGSPAGATGPAGGILVTTGQLRPGAPTLDVYEDFQCPACKSAESALGPTITSMAQAGEAKVVFHLKDFLDDSLGNDSSIRAANAAACAADAGRFLPYHAAVFAGQPAREGAGFTDDQLAQFARAAGITGGALTTWNSCVGAKTYNSYVERVEEQSARDGVNSTPTFRVNGQNLDLATVTSAEDFRAKVLARTGASATSPAASATGSASATPTTATSPPISPTPAKAS